MSIDFYDCCMFISGLVLLYVTTQTGIALIAVCFFFPLINGNAKASVVTHEGKSHFQHCIWLNPLQDRS